jgi:hypothetical protein
MERERDGEKGEKREDKGIRMGKEALFQVKELFD